MQATRDAIWQVGGTQLVIHMERPGGGRIIELNHQVGQPRHIAVLQTPNVKLDTLLLTIQGAQRAGQLLRCRRSQLIFSDLETPTMRAVLQVPGRRTKRGGRYRLTGSATTYLAYVLREGYLQALEGAYRARGETTTCSQAMSVASSPVPSFPPARPPRGIAPSR